VPLAAKVLPSGENATETINPLVKAEVRVRFSSPVPGSHSRTVPSSPPLVCPRRLRALRALEAFERIGTAEARGVLRGLAEEPPEALLTQEVKASLERLAERDTSSR
jgi:hypothetical protein